MAEGGETEPAPKPYVSVMMGNGKFDDSFMSTVEKYEFGKMPDGDIVYGFKFTNKTKAEVHVISLGATVQKVCMPDKDGKVVDVVHGFETVEEYLSAKNPYFGCHVGRVSNRIAGGKFTLDDVEHILPQNNGPNCLHGGTKGFDKANFKVDQRHDVVIFDHTSPDGDQGFPGAVSLNIEIYVHDTDICMEYRATSTAATPISIANHSYFNLAGHDSGSVKGHELELFCNRYIPVNDVQIPLGTFLPVKDTPFDFTEQPRVIGDRLHQVDGGGQPGYDHCYEIIGNYMKYRPVAKLRDPVSGRYMKMYTTMPGVQLYTSNFLDGSVVGKEGVAYPQHSAVCLEAQFYPDAINQRDLKYFYILRPLGPPLHERTHYEFYA